MQGINAIIFYAPVLFEQIAGGATGSLLSTVVVDTGKQPHSIMCTNSHALPWVRQFWQHKPLLEEMHLPP